ncbi:DUF3817 domain-containing protein [Spiractinospora alimapuensis]|uniref:DUF3817 domain-containing protein n=1 Tax=Spiractinospora alimapuensis TaxID=2820884 RepID=UPI001F3ED561|nr:DUF3817 domain-containing protein [Spiractinospora alimapuensis]QVQ52816.1 DUF3817 domain-containing protein [Spiractinospora alimapuensis]
MSTPQSQPLSPVGRAFAVIAFVEAATWAGLLAGMFLKNVTETTELGVTIFGWLHGAAFMLYVAITLIAALKLRWPLLVTGLALLASIPPLVTVLIEMWVRRRGLLADRGSADRTAGDPEVEAGAPSGQR